MNKINLYKIIIAILIVALISISIVAFLFYSLSPKIVYYNVPSEKSFIYNLENEFQYGFENYIKKRITIEKSRLINEKNSFIYVNLKEMKIFLYENGKVRDVFDVKAKGRKGSYWETAPGFYFVGEKLTTHFSSISHLWMPYAVQFYGNFFIHGWPYDRAGRLIQSDASGGCVRLQTKDAAVVFEFAKRGMPVLVFEEKLIPPLPALLKKEIKPFFNIKSNNSLIADLDTGEILLNKDADWEIYSGPLTLIMTALSGSEMISLGRRIIARDWMFDGINENIIIPGRSYRGHELINLILTRSSQEASLVWSRFLTPEAFVDAMNVKAKAIGMNHTYFVDVTGKSEENKTNLYDAAKMMRYIHQYRGFIFENTRIIKGHGQDETKTLFAVFKMKDLDGIDRNIFIALVDSYDINKDLKNTLNWLSVNFDLIKLK